MEENKHPLLQVLKQIYDSRYRTDVSEGLYVVVRGKIMSIKELNDLVRENPNYLDEEDDDGD